MANPVKKYISNDLARPPAEKKTRHTTAHELLFAGGTASL